MHPQEIAETIRACRVIGIYRAFHPEEIPFLLSHRALTKTAKQAWLALADATALKPNLSETFTHQQIADMIGTSSNTAYKAVQLLVTHEFLVIQRDRNPWGCLHRYTVTLPKAGLEVLHRAPTRKPLPQGRPLGLQDYRQCGFYHIFHVQEIRHLMCASDLNAAERLLWILVANHTARKETLTCQSTYEALGKQLNRTPNSVYRTVQSLEKKGYLSVCKPQSGGGNFYTLQLPEAHLALLQSSAPRGASTWKAPDQEATTASLAPISVSPVLKSVQPPDEIPQPSYESQQTLSITPGIRSQEIDLISSPLVKKIRSEPHSSLRDAVTTLTPDEVEYWLAYYEKKIAEVKVQHPTLHIVTLSQRALQMVDSSTKAKIQLAIRSPRKGEKIHAPVKEPMRGAVTTASTAVSLRYTSIEIGSRSFLVEKDLALRVVREISQRYAQGSVRGMAKEKPLAQLLQEILFYVTNAPPEGQTSRYHRALALCRDGRWETPKAMAYTRSCAIARR